VAARMMGSAGEMPNDASAALDAVADLILVDHVEIMDERERILEFARWE